MRRAAANLRRMNAEYVVLQRQMYAETRRTGSGDGCAGRNLRGEYEGKDSAHHRASDNPGTDALFAGRASPQHYVIEQCQQFPLGDEEDHAQNTAIGEYRRARQGAVADGILQPRGRERGEAWPTGAKQEASAASPVNPLQATSRYTVLPE